MTDFSFLSDTDDSAVEEILAEAIDHSVLKQVAAINCASFSHSVLPSHLESRFQRLKTFPSSSAKPITQLATDSADELKVSAKPPPDKNPISSDSSNLRAKSRSGHVSSPSNSPNSSPGYVNFPKIRATSGEGKGGEGKSRSGSFSFRSNSSDSSDETAKAGCFWCSPKRVSRKKSGDRNGVVELGIDWEKHDKILADLKSFSSKEQKKMMKKAMKEQDKINEESEKIVTWAKQASARMDFSVIDDDLSDDDNGHHHFGQ